MANIVFVGLLLFGCGDNTVIIDSRVIVPFAKCETPTFGTTVDMRLVAKVPNSAVLVTSPRDDQRLFVVEQPGAIRIIDNGAVLPEPFLDLSADADGPVICCEENGLLGLAFHPQYATNGRFFVTYTAVNPDNPVRQRDVLARCSVSADPNKADAASCVEVLSIPDFASNHNGGMIEFGPDNYLYWATGDGGGSNDRTQSAQALEDGVLDPRSIALLGKMLRIDVDNAAPGLEYGIPSDNPFASGGGKPEIFMLGLRNPWRWSFDRATGDMWIADVGQGRVEELTVVRANQQTGANLGWPIWEGAECFNRDMGGTCSLPQIVPQDQRLHSDGWVSITGGEVYRGTCFPDLVGTYFYTDYDDVGRLATARLQDDGSLAITDLPNRFPPLGASIHGDAAGELYETDTSGNIYQLVVIGP